MRRRAHIALILAVILVASCAKPRPQPSPAPAPAAPTPAAPPPKQNLIVLLEEGDARSTVYFSNSAGTTRLMEAKTAIRVERADAAPSQPFVIGESETQRLFWETLTVLPEPAVSFLLYFDEARDILTSASLKQVNLLVQAIRDRRSTSISITGHTDTTDSTERNYELGLRRAKSVAELLIKEGLSPENLVIASHGENDLLIKTPDNTDEPRNRRVEVIVR
jgi:outer membrane protein OmpA-like peptidoglycan-associated protein